VGDQLLRRDAAPHEDGRVAIEHIVGGFEAVANVLQRLVHTVLIVAVEKVNHASIVATLPVRRDG